MREYVTLHMINHFNKEAYISFTATNKLLFKLLLKLITFMKPAMETKFGVTFGQIYLVLTLIITTTISLGTAYTNINTRLTDLETTKNVMIESDKIERAENREEHKMIVEKLDNNNETLNQLVGAVNSNTKATNRLN